MKMMDQLLLYLSVASLCVAQQTPTAGLDCPAKGEKIYSVGKDVSPPVADTAAQSKTDIKAGGQNLARPEAKISLGTVIVEIVISSSGNVCRPKIIQTPDRELATKALAAVQQWKFKSAIRKGQSVPVKLYVGVNFRPD